MLVLAGIICFPCSCRKRDIRRATIQTPTVASEADARTIVEALSRFKPAVKDVIPDTTNHTVLVIYDSMILALKNLEYAIAQTGFDANETKAFTNAPPGAAHAK